MKKTALLTLSTALVSFSAMAEEEAVLNVYNWSDYIAEDTLAKFEAETGIKVTYDVYDSNEVLEAKLLAGSTGYDVVVPTGDFMERQIAAGVYQPLNKDLLPNLANMDPEIMANAEAHDPGNAHSVIYMWGTTGIGYNVEKVKEALGEDAPVNSWALVFDPQYASKLKDCGLVMSDATTEVIASALAYLGLDPNSNNPDEIKQAEELLKAVQPYVRYYHSSQYIDDLAAGEICVAGPAWSGDVFIAAADAADGVELAYSIPSEGALQWFDMLAIPADAPHPENAHKFINFIMDAQITADITNYVWYANANKASMELVDPEITGDPAIFPTPEVSAKLWRAKVKNAAESRLVNEAWAAVKAGN